MKKFTYLLFLALGVTACSVESIDSTENLLTADFSFDDSDFEVITHDYKNPQGGLRGTLSISQDCDNLYIAISGNPDGFHLGIYNENANPPLKQNGTIDHGSLPDNLITATNYEWVFPLASFTSTKIKIFARGWGGEWAGDNEFANGSYLEYNLSECEIANCESGYMFGDTPFQDLDETAKNWGWGQEFSLETGEFVTVNIQQKNEVLGEITITLNSDNSVTITEGTGVTVTHKYVADARPTDTAPGQFDKIGNKGDENGDGKFWVMIKAEVCK